MVKVLGNMMQVSSKYSVEELKKVERYAPEALTLFDDAGRGYFSLCLDIDGMAVQCDTYEDEDIKFEACACTPSGDITDKAIIFDSVSNDGRASVMIQLPSISGDVKLFIADEYGKVLKNLEQVEKNVEVALGRAEATETSIVSSIEVIDSSVTDR